MLRDMKEGLHFLCEKQKMIISHFCVNLCIYSHLSLKTTGDPQGSHMYLYLSLLLSSRIQREGCSVKTTFHQADEVFGVQCVCACVFKEAGKPKLLASNVGDSKFLLETPSV